MVRKRYGRGQVASGMEPERSFSQRQLRVAEELRHTLAKIFRQGE
jgi:hypothetical protein